MKTTESFKRFVSTTILGVFVITNLNPLAAFAGDSGPKIIYPIKEISKLECRFEDFSKLSSNCKQSLPILKTRDYEKYAQKNGGYNDFTRLYTVLWGSSYKYGWDVGNGGHLGTDIATAKGTPVYNIADGKVIKAKNDVYLGNYVSVEHFIKGKKIVSSYAHLSKINVKVGQKIGVGTKVGEVGSTGNSTGNHLHFQVDLPSPFYPYYYDYNVCPYNYSKISETGICFSEMKKHTVDPLLFLETSGAVLDNITVTSKKSTNLTKVIKSTINSFDMTIFNRTVYKGYDKEDIKKVQQLFRDLDVYRGAVNGNYDDIEDTIISYQISTKILKTKNDLGAGWFGPKTRAQAKKDYEKFLADGGKPGRYVSNSEVKVNNNVKTQKISRTGMLSREEIEAMEIEEFLKKYNIDLRLRKVGGNVGIGNTILLDLEITDKGGRAFRGNMPTGITFIADFSKVQVFPEKLYYFTDGKREIKLIGKKEGSTTLYVKAGKHTIESFKLNIFKQGKTIYPETGKVYLNNKVVLSETKTGIGLFRDSNGKKLINFKYGSTFKLKGNEDVQVCIKSGSLKDINRIYKKKCNSEDFKNEIEFTYNDTVGGLVLFDYKASGKNAKIELVNNYNNEVFSSKNLVVTNPKGLSNTYAYKNDIVSMLESGVVDGIKKGYFLEYRGLTHADSLAWIENTLNKLKDEPTSQATKSQIDNNLQEIKKERGNNLKVITRSEFLDLTYKYLVFDKSGKSGSTDYRDLDEDGNKKAAFVFDENTTWKDKFGDNYYRPDVSMTRGEGAFFLSNIIEKNKDTFLTLR